MVIMTMIQPSVNFKIVGENLQNMSEYYWYLLERL